jgi:hypothetical protein
MSVKFDKTNLSNDGDWLRADNVNDKPTSAPVAYSVSLWIYFESHVTGDPETIWFYGDKGAADKLAA